MTSHDAVTVRSVPLHIKLASLGVALTPLCVLLALLEIAVLAGGGADLAVVILVTIANLIPLVLLGLRYVRFERRWIVSIAMANAIILLGFVLVPTVFSGSRIRLSGPPSGSAAQKAGIDIIKTETQHAQLGDRGPDSVKDSIQKQLDDFLNGAEQSRSPPPLSAPPQLPQIVLPSSPLAPEGSRPSPRAPDTQVAASPPPPETALPPPPVSLPSLQPLPPPLPPPPLPQVAFPSSPLAPEGSRPSPRISDIQIAQALPRTPPVALPNIQAFPPPFASSTLRQGSAAPPAFNVPLAQPRPPALAKALPPPPATLPLSPGVGAGSAAGSRPASNGQKQIIARLPNLDNSFTAIRPAPSDSAVVSKTIIPIDPQLGAIIAAPTPTPTPQPPTNNAAPTTVPDTIKTGTYWSTWLDNSASADSKNMIAGSTYTLTLDLSAFDYAALRKVATTSTVKADSSVDDALKDTVSRDIYLTIKPVIPEGSGLRLQNQTESYVKKVDRDRLRKPDIESAGQYRDRKIEIVDLSRKVSAVSFPIVVTAEAAGCATIAFSIFDGFKPLDHLVQRIAIGDSSTSAPTCDVDDPNQNAALSGGLDSLREVNLGIEGSAQPFTAAGAFHIFDSASWSMAVFVDGRPGQTQSIYGWQTDGSVIDFMRKDSFQALIQKARKDSANKKPGSYIPVARELEKVMFRAKPGTSDQATKAEAAFLSLVKEAADPPVIVVRVASSAVEGQNRSLYLPLGILGAQGPNAVLDKPIIVVQPMAIERYAPKDRCIGEWTFAVPSSLNEVPATVMPANFFPAKLPGERISSIEKFRPYLDVPTAADAARMVAGQAPPAVGFVVLAHQDEGNLWFDQPTDHIIKQDINRNFPLGSVGIFAACSVASPKGRNNELLQKLNERGVDTMIVSPFAIDALYGVTFAASFAEVLEDTAESGASPTILELYNRAIAKTGQKFKDKNDGDYADLGLEYVLLGNSAITLCKPATAKVEQ